MFLVITGLSLTAMWTCIAHTGYFIMCAVLLTFLRCPGFSRAMLLLSVPLNAVAEVNQQPALDLTGLSLLLLTLSLGTNLKDAYKANYNYVSSYSLIFVIFYFLSAGHWFVNQLWACFQIRGKPAAPLPLAPCDIVEPRKQPVLSCHSYPPSSTPQKWVCMSSLYTFCVTNDFLFFFTILSKMSKKCLKCLVKFPSTQGNIFKMSYFVGPRQIGSIYNRINTKAVFALLLIMVIKTLFIWDFSKTSWGAARRQKQKINSANDWNHSLSK